MPDTAEQHLSSITTNYSAPTYAFDDREAGFIRPVYLCYSILGAAGGVIRLTQEQCQLCISTTIEVSLAKYPVLAAEELRGLGMHTGHNLDTPIFATAILLGHQLLGAFAEG